MQKVLRSYSNILKDEKKGLEIRLEKNRQVRQRVQDGYQEGIYTKEESIERLDSIENESGSIDEELEAIKSHCLILT